MVHRRRLIRSALVALASAAGCHAPESNGVYEGDALIKAVEPERVIVDFMKRPRSISGRFRDKKPGDSLRVLYRKRALAGGIIQYDILGVKGAP